MAEPQNNDNMSNNPYTMSSDISKAGKDTYLRQSLLTVIVNYNKAMKARNLVSPNASYGPDKRREVIKNALISLLPGEYEKYSGNIPIEEASYLRTIASGIDTLAAKSEGLGTNLQNKASEYKKSFNNWYTNRNSPGAGAGGRTKKGRKNRKNKNKKSRKSKY